MQTTTRIPSVANRQPVQLARQAITLLLVDDDQILREVLQAILTLEGYKVVTAPDGATALQIAGRTRFEMVVTDFQMPGVDGFVLATQLTERRPALPILLISAADPTELPLAELARRKWDYLPKPLDNARMLQVIDRECLGWAMQGVGLLRHSANVHPR